MSDGAAHHRGAFGQAMHAAMTAMDQAMARAPMTGEPDQDFLAMMIPHHEGAVEMARLVLVHGRDPHVRQLAEEILAGQQAEIISMTGRLAALRARGHEPATEYPALGGARGPAPRR